MMATNRQTLRRHGLEEHGIENVGQVVWNAPTPALDEQVLVRREGIAAHPGPIVVRTRQHTGRSPNDKFIVDSADSHAEIWWGNVNRPFDFEAFRLNVPQQCPDVSDNLLDPRSTWSDTADYDSKAQELAERFEHNYRQYAGD